MKTTILAAAALVVALGTATASQASVANPFNPKPTDVLINTIAAPAQSVQRAPRPRNGEWYQGSTNRRGLQLAYHVRDCGYFNSIPLRYQSYRYRRYCSLPRS